MCSTRASWRNILQRSRLHQFTYRHSAFTNYTALSPQAHMLKAFVLVLSAQGGWSHGVLSTPNPRGCTPRGTGFDGLPYCSEFNGFGPNIVIGQQDGSETPSSTHACPHPGTRALMLCEHTQHKRASSLLQGATTAADEIVCNGKTRGANTASLSAGTTLALEATVAAPHPGDW